MVYPDLECVLALLAKGEHSGEIAGLLRATAPKPFSISIVHRLQVENAMIRFLRDSRAEKQAIARDALLLWQHYLREQVFIIRDIDLPAAFQLTTAWNAEYPIQPPYWHALIHVGIAAQTSATFVSFEPALRKRATDAGLKILPERL